jgi:Tol biopolymer transport system component
VHYSLSAGAVLAMLIVLCPALAHTEDQTVATAPSSTAIVEEAKGSFPVEPLFVHSATVVEAGRNDGNPRWSPSGLFFTFERSMGDRKEIRVQLADGTPVQTIYHHAASRDGEISFFFPGVVEDASYNAGITWSPDEYRFIFMSNGGTGNYDLFLGDAGGPSLIRMTEHREKDGQADWSRTSNMVVFVSGRTGKGDLYLLDVNTRRLLRITQGGREHLYPQWSPDGRRIAFMSGSSENHDIVVIDDLARPEESQRRLTTWDYDDLRPVWSPDGRKIAFYSNYNPAGDPRTWSIVVVNADGSDATEGGGLAAHAVAVDVVTDVERGPAWMPDSKRIVYVKNDRHDYHPIYVVNISDRTDRRVATGTKMNHDITCGPDGTIAFRAQVDQWDQIFVAKMKE